MTIKNMLNYHQYEKMNESDFGPSQTIPDQTMSLRTLLDRYAQGIPFDNREEIWEGEDADPIDPRRLDLSERHELHQAYVNELQEIKERQKRSKESKKAVSVLSTPSVDEQIS